MESSGGAPRVAALGPLVVRGTDGAEVDVTGARLRSLLIRLALDAGRTVSAGALIDDLWDGDPPAAPGNALQALVSRLRRAVPDLVESDGAGYRLAASRESVDVHRFVTLARRGNALLATDPSSAADMLDDALALWRGEPLSDSDGMAFAEPWITRLTERRLGAATDRLDARLRTHGGPQLVDDAAALVAANPLAERPRELHMRALCQAGRPAEALASYEEFRTALADRLGADPSGELRELHLSILRDEVPRAPRADVHHNLRSRLSSFVGRESELDEVAGMVRRRRLVTLAGPGGAGKTRLATELASRLVPEFPDGVWLVELAPITEPDEIAQAVLNAMGVRELGGIGSRVNDAPLAADRLMEIVGRRRLLLVLDNCEHLIAAAAALVDELIARCSELHVLATSREPLGITGEGRYLVPPLALPDGGSDAEGGARGYEAVRLFAERAEAVRSSFALDDTTVGDVVRICRALDGMPLAIELAAARLRILTPRQIADRLADRFRLLTDGSRTALPRHQTLRAVVDWSWDLLDEDERTLLRRLAVFTGGATIEAVEHVCGGTLQVLASLVDKSLVVVVPTDGTVRYQLLETIRVYAAERLIEAGEDTAARRAHARYFRGLAERADTRIRRRDQLVWLARLDADRENLHAALRWAVTAGAAPIALRLVRGLGWYWYIRSLRAESLTWGIRALKLPGPAPVALRARAAAACAMIASQGTMDMTRALGLLREVSESLDRPEVAAIVDRDPFLLVGPVGLAMFEGDYAAAEAVVERMRANADPWTRAASTVIRAYIDSNQGEAGRAAELMEIALADFRELGERWGIAFALLGVAEYELDTDRMAAVLTEAQQVLTELGDDEDMVMTFVRMAVQRARRGDYGPALAELATADRISSRVRATDQQAIVVLTRAQIARWSGDLDRARRETVLLATLVGTAVPAYGPLQAFAAANDGYLSLVDGDLPAAWRHCATAVAQAFSPPDMPIAAGICVLLAAIRCEAGDPAGAAEALGLAEVLRGQRDDGDVDVARTTERARAALGAERFDDAYARGAAHTRKEAPDLLREWAGVAEGHSASGLAAERAERQWGEDHQQAGRP